MHLLNLRLTESKAHIYFLQALKSIKLVSVSLFKFNMTLDFEVGEPTRQIGKLLFYSDILLKVEVRVSFQINRQASKLRKCPEV